MTSISTKDVMAKASNEDLKPLVEYILKASTTESLSGKELYKAHNPNHQRYTGLILNEIRLFGGNSFVNLFRSEGPEYHEVVKDVASKFGVKEIDSFSLVQLEEELIQKILRDALKKAEGQERADMEAILKEAGLGKSDLSALLSGASLLTLLGARAAGVVTYQLSAIIASAMAKQLLGYGITLAAGGAASAALGRGLAVFMGPIGWILTGIWTAIDLAGPAFRVTVPCVLHIAMLRQKMMCAQMSSVFEGAFDD
ncbi:hypothetical protein E4T63_24660 [Pseudomonas fluorescens]|uniref:DUF3944 domain-containing protein n=1 Tax=Pseudomonas fluorescens TaxID=294 RepID=A0AAP8Z1I0_PSEFL|nr:ubiquinol-cytochrome C chaperone family protein [Pseudomonas fluorescens]QBX43606.1 hypothetical protein E4T63_24660 [Pseudomonas fluorescens]